MAADPPLIVPAVQVCTCPACPHNNPGAPRTSALDIELARNIERAVPASLRKLYFLARGNRRPSFLRAVDEVVAFIDSPGPPATTFLSLDREDREIRGSRPVHPAHRRPGRPHPTGGHRRRTRGRLARRGPRAGSGCRWGRERAVLDPMSDVTERDLRESAMGGFR